MKNWRRKLKKFGLIENNENYQMIIRALTVFTLCPHYAPLHHKDLYWLLMHIRYLLLMHIRLQMENIQTMRRWPWAGASWEIALGVVWYAGMVWCGMVGYGMVWYGMVVHHKRLHRGSKKDGRAAVKWVERSISALFVHRQNDDGAHCTPTLQIPPPPIPMKFFFNFYLTLTANNSFFIEFRCMILHCLLGKGSQMKIRKNVVFCQTPLGTPPPTSLAFFQQKNYPHFFFGKLHL